MEAKELQTQLEQLKTALETSITEKAKAEVTAQIKSVEDKLKSLETVPADVTSIKDDIKVIKDNADKNQEWIDKQIAMAKDIPLGNRLDKGNFNDAVFKELKTLENELKNYKKTRTPISFEVKAVGDIGTANFTVSPTTARFINSTDFGPVQKPFNPTHMRDLIAMQPVAGDSVVVLRDSGGEGAPTTVAEGALKPQSDRDWVKVVVPITKIAHWYRIPEEWLNDVSWLASEISRIGTEELLAVEDAEIISNNVAGEFTGLEQNSTAFAAPSSLALGVDTANFYDVLVAAWTQAKTLKENPNGILLHPGDYAKTLLKKDSTGNYLFGPNTAMPNVMGVPIYPMNQMTVDKFFIGDFTKATIAVREGISVRFYDQDGDNARKNLVTVVIEERIALVVRRTTAFIFGDLTDAAAALETA
jgi:HK97 family phage major capsid protein